MSVPVIKSTMVTITEVMALIFCLHETNRAPSEIEGVYMGFGIIKIIA